jgi:hypothetical protein
MQMAAGWGFEEGVVGASRVGLRGRRELRQSSTKDEIELQHCYVLYPSVLDRGTRPDGSRGWIWWTVWFTQSRKHPAGAGARFGSAHRRRAARLSIVDCREREPVVSGPGCDQCVVVSDEGNKRLVFLARSKFSAPGKKRRRAAGWATQRQRATRRARDGLSDGAFVGP